MNTNSNIILKADNVTKKFGGLVAVNNVSFSLRENEIAGLIGANGAGKTTFFNILTGNYIPEEGTIFYKGRDITRLSPERRVDLGIMRTFQLASTFDNLTVLDNLRLAYLKPIARLLWVTHSSRGWIELYQTRSTNVWIFST